MNEHHIYGMRLRGFAPGCQPMRGLVEDREYHGIIIYDRELTEAEIEEYDLDYIGMVVDEWTEKGLREDNGTDSKI